MRAVSFHRLRAATNNCAGRVDADGSGRTGKRMTGKKSWIKKSVELVGMAAIDCLGMDPWSDGQVRRLCGRLHNEAGPSASLSIQQPHTLSTFDASELSYHSNDESLPQHS
jgi:hypothetical protein